MFLSPSVLEYHTKCKLKYPAQKPAPQVDPINIEQLAPKNLKRIAI